MKETSYQISLLTAYMLYALSVCYFESYCLNVLSVISTTAKVSEYMMLQISSQFQKSLDNA